MLWTTNDYILEEERKQTFLQEERLRIDRKQLTEQKNQTKIQQNTLYLQEEIATRADERHAEYLKSQQDFNYRMWLQTPAGEKFYLWVRQLERYVEQLERLSQEWQNTFKRLTSPVVDFYTRQRDQARTAYDENQKKINKKFRKIIFILTLAMEFIWLMAYVSDVRGLTPFDAVVISGIGLLAAYPILQRVRRKKILGENYNYQLNNWLTEVCTAELKFNPFAIPEMTSPTIEELKLKSTDHMNQCYYKYPAFVTNPSLILNKNQNYDRTNPVLQKIYNVIPNQIHPELYINKVIQDLVYIS